LSGILLALAFTIPFFQPLAFVLFVPLIITFAKLKGKVLFGHALSFSLPFWITLVHWTYIYATVALPMMIVAFILYTALFTLISTLVLTSFGRWRVLLFPVLWVAYEFFYSLGYLGFPWGTSAVAIHKIIPLIQIADFSGIWGVSFFILIINSLLADIWLNRKEKRTLLRNSLLLLAIFLATFGYGLFRLSTPLTPTGYNVGLVQGNLDPNSEWKKIKELTYARLYELTGACVKDGADFVSWWETPVMDYALYYLWIFDNSDRNRLDKRFQEIAEYDRKFFNIAKEFNVPIMSGLPDAVPKRDGYDFYNAAVLIDTNGQAIGKYYKMHLVPFGEWFPYARIFPFIAKMLEDLGAGEYTPGHEYKVFEARGKKFSVVICYEGIFGEISRRMVNNGAEFLLNITDDMWSFSKTAELQHSYLDIFRAVENRVSFLRAANAGHTCMIDPYGRIRASLPLFQPGHLVVETLDHPQRGKTFYSRTGEWVGWASLIVTGILSLVSLILLFLQCWKRKKIS
jgi:apolipoprotein N-acyltransferase